MRGERKIMRKLFEETGIEFKKKEHIWCGTYKDKWIGIDLIGFNNKCYVNVDENNELVYEVYVSVYKLNYEIEKIKEVI